MLRKNSIRLLSVLFYIALFSGFMYQVSDILNLYLKYQAVTELTIEIPKELKLPDLDICLRLIDTFNFSQFENERNITLTRANASESETLSNLLYNVNPKDLIYYTPNLSSIFKQCDISLPESLVGAHLKAQSCAEQTKITKFIMQEFMCYRIHVVPYENSTYYYRDLAYPLTQQGLFYRIEFYLDTVLEKVQTMKLLIQTNNPNDTPMVSSAFAALVYRKYNVTTRTARSNSYHLNYYMLTYNKLPPPFETKCFNYKAIGMAARGVCLRRCINKFTIDAFNKVTYHLPLDANETHMIIGVVELQDANIEKRFYDFSAQCNNVCLSDDCKNEFYITSAHELLTNENVMRFTVNVPKEASFKINNIGKMQLVELIIYLLSCFGTWFGLSVIGLKPMADKCYRRLCKTRTARKHKNNSVASQASSHGQSVEDIKELKLRVILLESRLLEHELR